jgi:DNA polymerase III epsilon subunit-like protein
MHAERPRPQYSADIVVIDLEASSSDDPDNEIERSNIIELGAVRLDRHTLRIVDTFSELVRPRDYPIRPFITRLTGITPEMVADKEEFHATAERFVSWFGRRNKAFFAAFGVYYDLPLLRKEFRSFGFRFQDHFTGGALDIRSLALYWLAEHGRNTSNVTVKRTLEKMGLGDRGLSFHRALDDARGTAAILQFVHFGTISI